MKFLEHCLAHGKQAGKYVKGEIWKEQSLEVFKSTKILKKCIVKMKN